MSIKGKTARHMLTQKLMGSRTSAESRVLLLRNMVTHDEVNIIIIHQDITNIIQFIHLIILILLFYLL